MSPPARLCELETEKDSLQTVTNMAAASHYQRVFVLVYME